MIILHDLLQLPPYVPKLPSPDRVEERAKPPEPEREIVSEPLPPWNRKSASESESSSRGPG